MFITSEKRSRAVFSKSLGLNDLAMWLLQEFGNDYKGDVDKLKSEYDIHHIM